MSDRISDNVTEKLREIAQQHADLALQLMDTEVLSDHRKVTSLSIKKAAIAPLVERFETYESTLLQAQECAELLDGDDAELAAMAKDELPQLDSKLSVLTQSIQKQLVTADEQTVGSIILEIRAGVGGDEAAIWASDLEDMYTRFASIRGWKVVNKSSSPFLEKVSGRTSDLKVVPIKSNAYQQLKRRVASIHRLQLLLCSLNLKK